MEWNLKLTSNFLHSLLSPDILMPYNSVFPNVTYVMWGSNSELEELDPIAKLRILNRVSFFCSFFFLVFRLHWRLNSCSHIHPSPLPADLQVGDGG